MTKLAAIHQPNFFPWLGFFNKMYRSDAFVILDDVQFPKKGGYWANRVPLLISGKSEWLTIPVDRSYHGYRNINEMIIDNSKPWKEKILKTINTTYAKAPYYKDIFPIVDELLTLDKDNLFEYNYNILDKLIYLFELQNKEFHKASELKKEGKATDLIISILKKINADGYICGSGSENYQEDEKFEQNNIKLIKQDYMHPVYEQFNTSKFEKGLSVIDALMNTGIEGTKDLIKQG